MRTLEPANRKRIGLMGLIVTVMTVLVGQTLTSIPQIFAQPSYFGQFTDSGQLNKGDKVRISPLLCNRERWDGGRRFAHLRRCG